MKLSITCLFTILAFLKSFGQITTMKPAPKVEQIDSSRYDSSENFLAIFPNKYIGQEFYLKGVTESLRKYGYRGFFLDYNQSTFPDNKSNVYKCCDSEFYSKYAELTGKYFKVLEVIKHPDEPPAVTKDELHYPRKWFIKLQEKESSDIVYFEFDGLYEHNFPFIVVGFFEKQKRISIGQEFVFAENMLKGALDIETGNEIFSKLGEKWKCIDLTIEEKYYNLSLVLQNSLGEKTSLAYDLVLGKSKVGLSYSISEADYFRKRFGSDNFDQILQKKFKIGMTKEMCELARGKPKSINETIISNKKTEQWVYSDNTYLYFDNGILNVIQNN